MVIKICERMATIQHSEAYRITFGPSTLIFKSKESFVFFLTFCIGVLFLGNHQFLHTKLSNGLYLTRPVHDSDNLKIASVLNLMIFVIFFLSPRLKVQRPIDGSNLPYVVDKESPLLRLWTKEWPNPRDSRRRRVF